MDGPPDMQRNPGGNVEPLDRGFVVQEPARDAMHPAERYELRDPRADLTYRMRTFVDMVTKANQIGAHRFVAIAADGSRSTVSKVAGVWRRDDLQPDPALRLRREPGAAHGPVPLTKIARPEPAIEADVGSVERKVRIARMEAALHERYEIRRAPIRIGDVTIGQTEYRHRGDTSRIAFTESAFRLSTDNNSPSVARSMVDVAEARGWQALRVSGNEDFRRMVWLEASLRDIKTVGYEAVIADQELLRKERDARFVNRVEPLPTTSPGANSTSPARQSERGSGGRKAVLAALEAVLVAKKVPEKQREAVMAAAAERLAVRTARGETHRVKVYDRAAPSQTPVVTPSREVRRERERSAPSR